MSSWIKVRTNLATHPHVVRIASALCLHPVRIVGACVHVWSVADAHADGDLLHHMTPTALDTVCDTPGFTLQMVEVGWIKILDEGLEIVNFSENNGPNSKRRFLDASRKQASRIVSASCPHPVRDLSQKKRPRIDKIRKDNTEPPLPPSGGTDRTTPTPSTTPSTPYDPSSATLPMPIDTPEFRAAWCRWWKYRRERKQRPYAASTIDLRLAEFVSVGSAVSVQMITESISQGWLGVFQPKTAGSPNGGKSPPRKVSEIMAEEAAAARLEMVPRPTLFGPLVLGVTHGR